MEIVTILHNIRSLHNVGSVFRTSDGAGVKKIYLTGYTPAPFDKFGEKIPQLAKVSLGAEDYLPWEKVKSVDKVIADLKRQGYKILAIEQDRKSVAYNKSGLSKSAKVALLMGNEVRGLAKATLRKADVILEIPMLGKKESLNVSVAYGVAVYRLAVR